MSKGLCNGSSSRLGSPEDVVDHQSGIDFCNWIKYSEKKQTLQCTTAPITLYYPKKLHYLSSGHIWTGQRIGLITWVSNFWIHKKFHSWVTSPDWGLFELSEYPYNLVIWVRKLLSTSQKTCQSGTCFPDGAVDKNPPAKEGVTRVIPGPGGSHMLQNN